VLWWDTNVSEDCDASIFREKKEAASFCLQLQGEDGGNMVV
jgi:hypothetical protein